MMPSRGRSDAQLVGVSTAAGAHNRRSPEAGSGFTPEGDLRQTDIRQEQTSISPTKSRPSLSRRVRVESRLVPRL